MINGLGVVGWGVGGIEAEAGMLGQPVYFLTPEVVGVHLTGRLREGVTATDLVAAHHPDAARAKSGRQVCRILRRRRGLAAACPIAPPIGNMSPEYGATMGFFPVDSESVNYLRATGRTEEQCAAFENYFRAQKMFGMPRKGEIDYSVDLELDLGRGATERRRAEAAAGPDQSPGARENFPSLLEKPVKDGGYGNENGDLGAKHPGAI